jgi:magnesium-transporting ATPase (P-type)
MVPHTCRVLRDGTRRDLPAAALVPGDLLVFEAGDAAARDPAGRP